MKVATVTQIAPARLPARARTAQRYLADPAIVSACLALVYPSLESQRAVCVAAGADCGVHPETVRRWIKGLSRPHLADVWPLLHRALALSVTAEALADLEAAIERLGRSS